ncbi:hypothetical protein [Thalassospira sp.]|uniref:hypothetical protein n=1 Tax=Thalassospira sp. TaxID=1912094 RepID=UPI00273450AA|nr:hypothetical protein [Thalassospira sp.]MDP2698654.1 hypothetical protein [Thalassospira sp.]
MPYVETKTEKVSDLEVLLKAIEMWHQQPGNSAFGTTGLSPAQDLQNVLLEMIAGLSETGSSGWQLELPDQTTAPKIRSLIMAALYAYTRHKRKGGGNMDIATIDINPTNINISYVALAQFVYLMLRIFLVSSALSLEGAISVAVAFLTWYATSVGEQDNHQELYINIAGMAASFVLWLSGWFSSGSLQLEWQKAQSIPDKISFVASQIGTVAAAGSMGVLAYLGTRDDTSDEIGYMLFALIAIVLVQNNKPAILQVRKGIDVLIHLIYALFSLVFWFFAATARSFTWGRYGGNAGNDGNAIV